MSYYKMTRSVKNIFLASLVLPAVWLLTSCTSDITQPSDTPGEEDQIPLLIKNITLEENSVVTRVATAPAIGSVIGVFRQTDSYYTTASNNIKYTRTLDKGWQVAAAGTDILLGADNSRALLYAYHPSNDKITVAADNVSVALAAREYDTDYDLSYVPAGNAQALDISGVVYNYHPGVNFPMKHAYTRLGVDLTRGDNYSGVGAVTAVSLTLNGGGNLYSTGTQNIATGNYTGGTADLAKLTYTVPADRKITAADKTASFSYLLPPGKSGAISNLLLTVTVDGVTTTTVISAAGLDLKAGTNYVVKATLDYYGLTAATLKTTDWDSQRAWNEEVGFVPEILWIKVGGYKWAVSNVVVTKQNDNTFKCEFAEEACYYSYKWDGGDYLCWNTLNPETHDVTQIEWSDNRDPCQNIGMEWSTPTDAQLQALVDAGSVWGTWTKPDNKTKINGRYFGITTQPSVIDQKKYLFLPAAGLRFNGGTSMMYDGTGGRYWTKSPETGDGYRNYLTFSNGNNCRVAIDGSRFNGYSIRCVHNR